MTKFVWFAGAAMLMMGASTAFAADAAKQPLAEATGDINGDGVPDRAQLFNNDGDVDLAIYLSAGGKLPAEPTLYKTALGWTGAMAGTEPGIAINQRGSIVVTFQNDSIGRDRWSSQFVIAWRNNTLVVAGYTYRYRDTLDLKHFGGCDLNLLTGKGTRNEKPVTVAPGGIPLADWSDVSVPKPCKFDD